MWHYQWLKYFWIYFCLFFKSPVFNWTLRKVGIFKLCITFFYFPCSYPDPDNSQCFQANNDLENLNQQACIPITSVHTGRRVINIPVIFNGSNHCAVSEESLSEDNLPEAMDEFIEDDENCEFTFHWKVLIFFLLTIWMIFIIYIIWYPEYWTRPLNIFLNRYSTLQMLPKSALKLVISFAPKRIVKGIFMKKYAGIFWLETKEF